MTRRPSAAELVEGPRARRLCLSAAALLEPRLHAQSMGGVDPTDDRLARETARLLESVDLGPVRSSTDPLTLAHQVGDTVVWAG